MRRLASTIPVLVASFAASLHGATPATLPAASTRTAVGPAAVDAAGAPARATLAIRDVCAWPNLVRLPDGTILAAVFNQPSHARAIGDVDVYASADGGATWTKRATAVPRDPSFDNNRMNLAFDRLPGGELMIVCSGWKLNDKPDAPADVGGKHGLEALQRSWVCRSGDGGVTWTIDKTSFPETSPIGSGLVPYGSIQTAADGSLVVAAYTAFHPSEKKGHRGFTFRSADAGKTWTAGAEMDPSKPLNETHLLHLGGGRWLAAARHARLEVYESTDDARTWRVTDYAGDRRSIPGMILPLADGRLMMCYGNRIKGQEGVEARVSADAGRTWSSPVRLADFDTYDGGYPSSVQRADGQVVTAYYARKAPTYDGYHMAVVTWDPAKSFPKQ